MYEGEVLSYQGCEVALYPLNYVNITATPSAVNHVVTGVSNSGLWDNGWYGDSTIRPLFAPFTMTCQQSYPTGNANGHTQKWVSTAPVWLPGYEEPQYATFSVSHSDTLYYSVGDTIAQGTHFYNTGTFGIGSGAHVHFCLYVGQRASMFPTGSNPNGYGNIWYSPSPPGTIADFFYLDPSDLPQGSGGYGGLDWQFWAGMPGKDLSPILAYLIMKKRRQKPNVKYL